MRRRAPHIPQRRRIFLGCEGQGEGGYGAFLSRVARDNPNLHVHIDVHVLQPGAGDPLALVERAFQLIRQNEKRRANYALKAVLLDSGEGRRLEAAAARARVVGIEHLIWQAPDHEALLLRHLPNCQRRRPPRGQTLGALRREWPEYQKPMSAHDIGRRITIESVQAACRVEPELCAFLRQIGLL